MGAVRKFYSVQVLRFVAAFVIVVYHSCFYVAGQLPDAPTIALGIGEAAVALFFAISGFVMTTVVDGPRRRTWLEFACDRIIRITPLYWVMTAVGAAAVLVGTRLVPTRELDVGVVLRSLFYLPSQNPDGLLQPLWPVGWTLAFEMAFYALMTIALALRVDAFVVVTPVLVVVAASSILRPDGGSPWWFYADPIVLFFLAGMAIARLVRHGRTPSAVGVLTILAISVAVATSLRHGVPDVASGVTAFGVMALLLVAVRTEHRIGARSPRWAISMGEASFSLYLTHPLIGPVVAVSLVTLFPTGYPPLVGVVLAAGLSFVAAPLVHRWVERPLNRICRTALRARRRAPAEIEQTERSAAGRRVR